jgi:hypothetical protein
MALAPFSVLARGKFRTDVEEERRELTGENGWARGNSDWRHNENEKKVSQALEKVAGEVGGKHITSGALTLGTLTAFVC